MSSARCSRDVLRRVVDNESIGLGKKRHRSRLLILSGIPDDGLRGVADGEIGGDGVGLGVEGAGCEDVDGGRGHGEGGVVPGEGDEVLAGFRADLVVVRRQRVRRDHRDTASGQTRVDGGCGC